MYFVDSLCALFNGVLLFRAHLLFDPSPQRDARYVHKSTKDIGDPENDREHNGGCTEPSYRETRVGFASPG